MRYLHSQPDTTSIASRALHVSLLELFIYKIAAPLLEHELSAKKSNVILYSSRYYSDPVISTCYPYEQTFPAVHLPALPLAYQIERASRPESATRVWKGRNVDYDMYVGCTCAH